MAALAILCLVARIPPIGDRRLRAGLVALGTFVAWAAIFDGAGYGNVTAGSALAFLLTGALLVFALNLPADRALPDGASRRYRPTVVAALTGVVALTLVFGATGQLGRLGYDRRVGSVQVGLTLRRILPTNALIAAPPETSWLRAFTERGVIADCKATPFGKAEWREYWDRIAALGGLCNGRGSGFAKLRPSDVEALQTAYGATHVLMFQDDPKLDYARAHWKEIFAAPAPPDGSIRLGVVVFELPPPR
jgi:hypothetical protein